MIVGIQIFLGVFTIMLFVVQIVILMELDEVYSIVNKLLTITKTTSQKHKKAIDSDCEDIHTPHN